MLVSLGADSPVAGAGVRIEGLRQRYEVLRRSVERYELIVEGQAKELEKVNRGGGGGGGYVVESLVGDGATATFTRDDLRREEREVKELEERRKLLEQRVLGMERDLGGLAR